MRQAFPVLVLVGTVASVAGCTSSSHSASAPTATVTVSASAPHTSTTPIPARSTPPTSDTTTVEPSSTMSAAAVVEAYYAAINAGDYQTAWNLGGDSLDPTYAAFVNGFASTSHDSLTITASQGDTVSVTLNAAQSNGSDQAYSGTYTVTGGHITSAQLTLTGSGSPNAPTTSTPATAPIMDPHGGYYSAGEYCPDRDAGLSTVDASGHTITCVLESGQYHWH
jgi:flagellar hook-associated protein FlgK